jgi:hypothetical protein
MGHIVQMDLADDVLLGMQKNERAMAAELRLAAGVKWYKCGMLSQEQAAAVAGLSRAEFLGNLARYGASPFQETNDEILAALK